MDPISLLLGFAGRIVPEVVHLFTAKQEAKEAQARAAQEQAMYQLQAAHELALAQVNLAKSKVEDEASFRQAVAGLQAPLVATGSRLLDWVNAINALFRPAVSFWLFGIFALVRSVELSFTVATAVHEAWLTGATWLVTFQASTAALKAVWTVDDANLLATVIAYWFVDRTITHLRGDA